MIARRKDTMQRLIPWIVTTIFLAYIAAAILRPGSTAAFDSAAFGRLPVSMNGRVQPIDSAARVALLQIRGTVTVPGASNQRWRFWNRSGGLDATEWLLEVLTRPNLADTRRIFRLPDATVRVAAVNAARIGPPAAYYAFEDLQPRVKEIGDAVARAFKVKPADRTPTDRAWLKLRDDLVLYERLKNTLQPNSFLQSETPGKPFTYDFGARLASYEADLRRAITARLDGQQNVVDETTQSRMASFARPYVGVSRMALVSFIPPVGADAGRDRWLNTGAALVASSRTGTFPTPVSFFARMSSAYAGDDPDQFNLELASYEKWLSARGLTGEIRRAGTESFYNRFQPFVRAIAIYLVAMLLGCASRVRRSRMLYRCSAMLLVLAGVLHAIGILFDMMLQGTLPVTNVYSATITAGAVGVVLGMILERKYRNGIALVGAAIAGLGTLIGAHLIAPGGARGLSAQVLDTGFYVAVAATVLTLSFAFRAASQAGASRRWDLAD